MKNSARLKKKKKKVNMYAWGQQNKKLFASIICIVLVIGMLVSLLQL